MQDECVAALVAQIKEMKIRHDAEIQAMQRRNQDLEQQLYSSAASEDFKAELASKLFNVHSHMDSLTQELYDIRRHGREVRVPYSQSVADEWASVASRNFFMELECDHRRDERSLKRSKLEKDLREKKDTIHSLRATLARRDRTIEALNAELKEAKLVIKRKDAELQKSGRSKQEVEQMAPSGKQSSSLHQPPHWQVVKNDEEETTCTTTTGSIAKLSVGATVGALPTTQKIHLRASRNSAAAQSA